MAADDPRDNPPPMPALETHEADYTVRDFQFRSRRNACRSCACTTPRWARRIATRTAQIDNAVMVLHGTGGDGHQFLRPQFAGELFGRAAAGHPRNTSSSCPTTSATAKSSKPSDGLRTRFPALRLRRHGRWPSTRLLERGARHRATCGSSWARRWAACTASSGARRIPTIMDALMPLACLPMEIAGRNRMWRKMIDRCDRRPIRHGWAATTRPSRRRHAHGGGHADPRGRRAAQPCRSSTRRAMRPMLSATETVDAHPAAARRQRPALSGRRRRATTIPGRSWKRSAPT